MAGEAQVNPTTYNDISSGKVVNKEGLLELSVKIKEYVAENAGGGTTYTAGNGIEINSANAISTNNASLPNFFANATQYPYMTSDITGALSEDFLASLNDLVFNYNLDVFKKRWQAGHGLFIIFLASVPFEAWYNGSVSQNYSLLKDSTRLIIQEVQTGSIAIYKIDFGNIWNFSQDQSGSSWNYTHSTHTLSQSYLSSGCWKLMYVNGLNGIYYFDNNTRHNLSGKDFVYGVHNNSFSFQPQIFTLSTVATSGSYNDLTDKPIPASSSTNGTYMLVDTVSNGTSTKSWETVPSGGGGATYTAGTGIDIDANNEISVDATDLSYNDLQDKPTIPTVPTNISAFTNDAGYLTSHQSLTGYATQNYVDSALSQVPSYSAGTGISIDANGVISLDLQNANGVSY